MLFVDLIVVFQSKRTDYNHIFLNFLPTLTLSDLAKVKQLIARDDYDICYLCVMLNQHNGIRLIL